MNRFRILSFILPLAILVLAAGCGNEAESTGGKVSGEVAVLSPKKVVTSRVVKHDFKRTFRATGSLMPIKTALLSALAGGPLQSVKVEIGDKVKSSQSLFRIRPTNYRLAVQSAHAALLTAKSALAELLAWQRPEEIEILKAELRSDRAEHERLKSELKRMEALYEKKTISESGRDKAKTAAEKAGADVRKVEERLKIAERGPTESQIAVAKARITQAKAALNLARQNLEDTTVHAPYDGVITGRYLRMGDYARPGQNVLEIADLSTLEAELELPEVFAAVIETGLTVDIHMEHLRMQRTGKVSAVNQKIDQQTRTFLVKVSVPNPEGKIKGGTFCTGIFHLPVLQNATVVPREAVVKDEGRSIVWLVKEGKAQRIFVKVGAEDDRYIEIPDGLEAGQKIIVKGLGALSVGDAVEIQGEIQNASANL